MFDQLLVSGHVRFEGYDSWLAATHIQPSTPLPLQLGITTRDTPTGATQSFSLLCGTPNNPAQPSLSSAFHLKSTDTQTNVDFDTLRLTRVAPDAPPLILDHFNLAYGPSTKVALRGEPAPSQQMRFSFAGIEYGAIRLFQGTADLALNDDEIVLNQIEARLDAGELAATAAFDRDTGLPTRGRVYLKDITAAQVLAALPAPYRKAFPGNLDAKLTARIFLTDSAPDSVSGRIELVSPEKARFTPAVSTSPQPIRNAELANFALSADLYWNLNPKSLPEISHGRFTADQILVVPNQANAPPATLDLTSIKSYFSLLRGDARLDDLYASLPGNGRFTAAGGYNLINHSLDKTSINLNGIDGSLITPWLPKGWGLTGQVDTGLVVGNDPKGLAITLSFALAAQTSLTTPDGELLIASSPAPSLSIRAFRQQSTSPTGAALDFYQIENADVSSIGKMQANGPLVNRLLQALSSDTNSSAGTLLNSLKNGAAASFDRITFVGKLTTPHLSLASLSHLPLSPPAVALGSLAIGGLDFGPAPTPPTVGAPALPADSEKSPSVQNLTFKADIETPLSSITFASFHLHNAELFAEKFTLPIAGSGAAPVQNIFSSVDARFDLEAGNAVVNDISLSFADGTVKGDAALSLTTGLDALHLSFSAINQQILTRSIYPDVITARGPISGTVSLDRNSDHHLIGTIQLTADQPGILRISRDTAQKAFAPAAKAAAQADQSTILPGNFDQIVVDQLANYPYTQGRATLRDDARGLLITLNYTRASLQPGEPGFAVPVTVQGHTMPANLQFQLAGESLTINNSVANLLKELTGFQTTLAARPSQPATTPRPPPPLTPATIRPLP